MQIKRLRIDNHRCLIDFDIKFQTTDSGSSTILIGENGAGKSTIIETILEILVSFDSPEIEKNISYSYEMQYIYAQRIITITQVEHRYRVVIDGKEMEESYNSLRSYLNTSRIFPKRIIAFYSGANDKLKDKIKNVNTSYKKKSKKAIDSFFKDMTVDQLESVDTILTKP